ncbi:MAG: hypothetical protein AAGE52_30820 [Myxococcota bacterium]
MKRVLWLLVLALACGESSEPMMDAGPEIDGGREDSGGTDAGGGEDAGEDSGAGDDAGGTDAGGEDAGEDAGMMDGGLEACDTPGELETRACGRCGTQERFCSASGFWTNGPCEGERPDACMPGEVGVAACGNCGSQMTRCTAECEEEPFGACVDEGECEPGTRTRTEDGCDPGETRELLCNDSCMAEEVTACTMDGCDTPGATETVDCGLCGTQERFCTAERVWEYDECTGEGVCMPGTTDLMACGMCGEQTNRCNTSCEWVPSGACMDEGECSPGESVLTRDGCPPGEVRRLECNDTCGFVEVDPCTPNPPMDITLLFDMTGSHATDITGSVEAIVDDVVRPLFGLGDTFVGVSYYAEFPSVSGGIDEPFTGGIRPASAASSVETELESAPVYGGGDASESGIEALHILTGGDLHPDATAISCIASRVPGGCWRTAAERVIVMITDVGNHNGPDPDGPGLLDPYTSVTPDPAEWPEVELAMERDNVRFFVVLDGAGVGVAREQYLEMLSDLGQPSSQIITRSGSDWAAVGAALVTALED